MRGLAQALPLLHLALRRGQASKRVAESAEWGTGRSPGANTVVWSVHRWNACGT